MKMKKMDRRTFIKTAGAAGLAVSALGLPEIVRSASRMSEVPIAAVEPMTGPTGSFGQNMMRGWNIAVDEINAEGGIKSLGGAKFKTELRDTQGNPRIGMAEVEKVAQDKRIPLMVGCWGSAVTYPATQVAEQYGLPHIVDIATQTDIMRRGFKYVFRYVMDNERTCKNFVTFVEEIGKRTGFVAKRAALMSVDDNFGRDIAAGIKRGLEKTNQQVVEEIYHPLKTTNVDVEVAKLKASKPDVIYVTAFLNDVVLITKALYSQRVDTFGICTFGGTSQPEYLKMVGTLANYICAQYKFDIDLNRPLEEEFETKMMKLYDVHANPFSACGYGIVYLIKDILERAGTVDREKVREAIAATNITSGRAMIMPGRFIRFDQNGENIGAMEYITQCLNGDWHTVGPVDIKLKHEAVWPAPKWESRKL